MARERIQARRVQAMTTFSESDIREAFQTFDRDGNGFIGTRPSISVLACAAPSSNARTCRRVGARIAACDQDRVFRLPANADARDGSDVKTAHVTGASDLHNTYLAINENLTDDEVNTTLSCAHARNKLHIGSAGPLVHLSWAAAVRELGGSL